MNLDLTHEQQMLQVSFARFLDQHSSMARVRAAAPMGFDKPFWVSLADQGAFGLRVPEEAGGTGLGTFDATILMEEVGRTLAVGPIAETILAARMLSLLGGGESDLLTRVLGGSALITLAYHDLTAEPVQWVAGGAVADSIMSCDGDDVLLFIPSSTSRGEANLASTALAEVDFREGERIVLASGARARATFDATIEEWKLLAAATLCGLARRAVEMAAAYAGERKAFDQFIGTFQAISHPLAVIITDVDAGKLLVWKTLRDIADSSVSASAQISLSLWWAADASSRAVSQAIQTFGGYGLTTEYDIHLYNLRAKDLVLAFGDPALLLAEGARRLYAGQAASLPDVGPVAIDFDRGEPARALATQVDAFFEANLTPELKAKAHFSWEGHDPEIHRKLAKAGLLFPDWPSEIGGLAATPYEAASMREVWEDHNWSSVASAVARMVGSIIHRFGGDELKRDVLAKLAAGTSVCSLGWSEPGAGSDVFACQTRATRDGDDWRIDGQKMFTSGAQLADYVYLIVRTNPDVPKHKGITMFIVPLDTPGITVQPLHSFQDEPTNITFYDNVLVPDRYRLGEVDGGLAVMAATLELEHSASYAKTLQRILAVGEDLCREIARGGRPLIEHHYAQERLAKAFVQTQLGAVLNERMLWAAVESRSIPACGPMARLQSAEAFFECARDLLELTAPLSLSKREGPVAMLNLWYRHGHAARIYGGSQEIQRSQIAERHLGMPRTRK
jgi:alkylation response protein AidB-like acyl-CoA dehydrogenase